MDALNKVDRGLDKSSLEIWLLDEIVSPLEAVFSDDICDPAAEHVVHDKNTVTILELCLESLADNVYPSLNELGALGDRTLREERI